MSRPKEEDGAHWQCRMVLAPKHPAKAAQSANPPFFASEIPAGSSQRKRLASFPAPIRGFDGELLAGENLQRLGSLH